MTSLLNILLTSLLTFTTPSTPIETLSCSNLSGQSLGNQYDAINTIRQTEFEFEQSFETLNQFGVRGATFYSCGGNGYMIVETNRRVELFQNVPRHVWDSFIQAHSIDRFYHRYIRFNGQFMY